WPVGIGLGVAFFGAVAVASSWRSAQYLAIASIVLAFALVAFLYRDPPDFTRSGGPLRFWPALPARGWALALAAGAVWTLFNAGFIVLVGFGPEALVWRGASLAKAGFLVSMAVLVSIVSVPLGGALADRTGRPNLAIALGCLVTTLAIVAMP